MEKEPAQEESTAEQSSSDAEKFWKEQGRELLKSSIPSIEAAGKQLITLLTTMQGIYLGVVAYSEFSKKLAEIPKAQHFLLVIPLLIWLGALYAALHIFRTQKYTFHPDDVKKIQETYENIAAVKQQTLTPTFQLIVAGLLAAVINIVIYFLTVG